MLLGRLLLVGLLVVGLGAGGLPLAGLGLAVALGLGGAGDRVTLELALVLGREGVAVELPGDGEGDLAVLEGAVGDLDRLGCGGVAAAAAAAASRSSDLTGELLTVVFELQRDLAGRTLLLVVAALTALAALTTAATAAASHCPLPSAVNALLIGRAGERRGDEGEQGKRDEADAN